MPGVEGFIYPNEVELQWSILIVLYPFITGLVAGAFILASLERVFNVAAVRPTYRLALLTALAFLLVAPLPLQMHLGHPERSFEMYLTPHRESAMAMFGFVYLWYLMGVLRPRDLVRLPEGPGAHLAREHRPQASVLRRADPRVRRHQPAGAADRRPGRPTHHDRRHPVGVPAARLCRLHLRVGQGQPVVVHAADADRVPLLGDRLGHRAVMLLYMVSCRLRRVPIDMLCLDTIARYLFYAFLIDFSLEMLDLIHRIYEADESFGALDFMVQTRLFVSHIVIQICLGTLLPIVLLAGDAGVAAC